MGLAVLAPREMVEYGSDPRRPLVADTACARLVPARGMAHSPAQSSHLRLVGEGPDLKVLPGVARAGRLAAGGGGLGYGGTDANARRAAGLFLLVLNVFLLLVGCLMDIFSAIVVVVPLLLLIGQVFGSHPLHLGMIFLANLELGYLTPPVGMNLFLASYRFDKPLVQVYQYAMPFLLILLVVVLLLTYVPALIIGAR